MPSIDPRARAREEARAIDREQLALADRGQARRTRPAGAPMASSAAARLASKPQSARMSCSGSTSRTRSQVVSTERSPSRPSSSQPPARRTISGTQ